MASDNQLSWQNKHKNTNIISTRRIIKVDKGNSHRLKPAQIEPATRSDLKTNCFSTIKSETHSIQSANHNQYSSRNSLRAAQTTASNDNSPNHKISNQMTTALTIPPERGVERTSNYDILDSDYFLKFTGANSTVCLLCGVRVANRLIESHSRSEEHISSYERLRYHLTHILPPENSIQMCAIYELLSTWYKSQALTDNLLAQRSDVIAEFQYLLSLIDPECRFRIIGSLNSGAPLVGSNINLELLHRNSGLFEGDPRAKNSIHHKLIDPDANLGSQINNHTLHYDLIPNAFETLYKIMEVVSRRYPGSPGNAFEVIGPISDLNGKTPRLTLQHTATKIDLEIVCYAGSSYKLSNLLAAYMSLDNRVPILGTLVKHWAKHCNLDNPNQGTLPPYAFIILVIYYLQRTSPPILPCLHEIISKSSKKEELPPRKDSDIPTELMSRLDLHNKSHKNEKSSARTDHLEKKVIDDLQDNNVELGDEEEEDEEEEDSGCIEPDSDLVKNLNWASENRTSVHKLFIDFLRTMVDEFGNISTVITIRMIEKTRLSSKGWFTQVKAIENPVLPRVNISRCIGSHRIFEYIKGAFKHSYYYLTSIPIDSRLRRKTERQIEPSDYIELYVNHRRFESYFKMKEASVQTNQCNYDPVKQMIEQNLFSRDVEVINALFDEISGSFTDRLPRAVANSYSGSLLLPKDVAATIFCWLCKRIGHTREKCPTGKIQNLRQEFEDYDLELDIRANFDDSFSLLYKRESISREDLKRHGKILDDLTEIIRSIGLNCQLRLFGSTVNNLGSRDSDLDICMTIEGNPTGRGVDCVSTLAKVSEVLEVHKMVESLEPILSARVPILKFKFDSADVDLSMYNQCAIYNSELLKTYANIDERVAPLFLLVKKYAKVSKLK